VLLITAIMPFPMKIQPIDYQTLDEPVAHQLESVKPVGKSRLKRLFERQFLRNSAAEKVGAIEESHLKDGCNEFEPSSVCLAKMVQNFIEDSNEKQPSVRCNRNRCNCFNGNCNDSSEDEFDSFGGFGDSNLSSSVEAIEILKVIKSIALELNFFLLVFGFGIVQVIGFLWAEFGAVCKCL